MSIKSIERVLKNRKLLLQQLHDDYPESFKVLTATEGGQVAIALLVLAAIVEDLSDVVAKEDT